MFGGTNSERPAAWRTRRELLHVFLAGADLHETAKIEAPPSTEMLPVRRVESVFS